MIQVLKRCSRCKLWKNRCSFSKNKTKKDGYAHYCKQCKKEYNAIKNYGNYYRPVPESDKLVTKKKRTLVDGKLMCRRCKQWLEMKDFPKDKNRYHGVHSYCKPCSYSCQKETRNKVNEKYFQIQNKYGLSREEYDAMIIECDNKCSICRRPEKRLLRGKPKTLVVDHDHKTGKVRGLICHGCNSSLGYLEDNIEYFLNAVEYLRQHQEVGIE